MEPTFIGFPKIARHRRTISISEKIDGTNAQVYVDESGTVRAGSRTRWITPENDNYGFAKWVHEHTEELKGLGSGAHFGEWWGSGIQRRYGLDHKRFSLFNSARWADDLVRPACCHIVPVLYTGSNSDEAIERCLQDLRKNGSVAAPGFMQPEGIVIYHAASRVLSKVTLDNDHEPKGQTLEQSATT